MQNETFYQTLRHSFSSLVPAQGHIGKIAKLYARPIMARQWQRRSKYMPHYGAKQAAKAAAKAGV